MFAQFYISAGTYKETEQTQIGVCNFPYNCRHICIYSKEYN